MKIHTDHGLDVTVRSLLSKSPEVCTCESLSSLFGVLVYPLAFAFFATERDRESGENSIETEAVGEGGRGD